MKEKPPKLMLLRNLRIFRQNLFPFLLLSISSVKL